MLEAYSIYDKKMNKYSAPNFLESLVPMQRSLQTVLQDKTSNLARFVEDYDVYRIGTFDENTGAFVYTQPLFICALSAMNPVERPVKNG